MNRGRHRAGLPPSCAGIVAVVFYFVACGSVGAQELFVVEDVPVDITAETAAEARERGIEQATRTAFDRLTDRLASEPGFGPAPQVSGTTVQNLVEGIEFADEKASAVRYLAKITVRFRPDAVRSLYGRAGGGGAAYQRPAAYGGPALLVVPVYEWAGTRVVWEKFNPWWQAWEEALGQPAAMPIILPEGDPRDMGTLSAEAAATGDRARILALADRRSAAGALVARAALDRSGPAPALDLVVTSFGGVPSSMGLVDRVTGSPGETIDNVARRAVAKVMAMVDGVASGRSPSGVPGVPGSGAALQPGGASTVVTADLDSPADLTALRRAIGRVVAREELVSLSRGRASLRLFHSGDREMLRRSLSGTGIVVTDTSDGWLLSLPGSSASPPTSPSLAPSGGR